MGVVKARKKRKTKTSGQREVRRECGRHGGRSSPCHSRWIIIQFVKWEHRSQTWKLSSDCDVCKQAGREFAEDLTKEDKAARELLRPRIKEARDQKKRACFRGPFWSQRKCANIPTEGKNCTGKHVLSILKAVKWDAKAFAWRNTFSPLVSYW